MKLLRFAIVAAALIFASPAIAQFQVPNHSVPVGRGAGVTGFGSVVPGAAGLPLVSNGPNADPSYQGISGQANVLQNYPGATGDVQLLAAIAAGVKWVQLSGNATFANTAPITLPTGFSIFCNNNYINQSVNTTNVFNLTEGDEFLDCNVNGNGNTLTGNTNDFFRIVSGNNQHLTNVKAVNTYGHNLVFNANVGGNFSWNAGSFNRTCSTPYTILSGAYSSTTGLVTLTTTAPVTVLSGTTSVAIFSLSGTGSFDSLRGSYAPGSVSGSTITYTAATGLGAGAIAGGFVTYCPSTDVDAITFASSEAGTTGPRNFVNLNGNGSWGFNLNAGHYASIKGGSMQCMDFNANANYFFIADDVRIACHPVINGINGFVYAIFDAAVTLGTGAQNIKIAQQVGFTDIDASGGRTNQIIPAAGNTYHQYMAVGNTVGWELDQAGSAALTMGTDASNNPYVRGQNNLPLGFGINTTNYLTINAGFFTGLNAAAPATPASGNTNFWFDATDLRFHDRSFGGLTGTTAVGYSAVIHQFLIGMNVNGTFAGAQPAFSDISGTLAPGQCPNPSASTIGCVESYVAVAHQWINTISTLGVPSSSQPVIADISGWGTNVATALGNALNGASGLVGFSGNLGTPTAGTLASGITINGTNVTWTGTIPGTALAVANLAASGNGGVTGILPVANGGTNAASASGTALDNITGFAATGFLTRTGTGTYAFQSTTGGITNANLANSTISGIALGSSLGTLTFGTHLASGGASYNGSAGVTITSDATNLNTASTIVARDASGNFTAGTVTASLTGHASLDLALTGGTLTGALNGSANAIPFVSNPTGGQQNFQLQNNGVNVGFFGSNASTPLFVQNSSGINVVSFNFTGGAGSTAVYPNFSAQVAGSPAIYGVTGTNADIEILPNGAGNIWFAGSGSTSVNGTVATVLGSLGPVGSHTTVQEWLTYKNPSGVVRYIAAF